jgi:hypothetical protein
MPKMCGIKCEFVWIACLCCVDLKGNQLVFTSYVQAMNDVQRA